MCTSSRQLCQCLEQILKYDFPEKCSNVVTQIHAHLSSDHQETWLGSLLALYQLSKKYKLVTYCTCVAVKPIKNLISPLNQ